MLLTPIFTVPDAQAFFQTPVPSGLRSTKQQFQPVHPRNITIPEILASFVHLIGASRPNSWIALLVPWLQTKEECRVREVDAYVSQLTSKFICGWQKQGCLRSAVCKVCALCKARLRQGHILVVIWGV